jgi:predicted permease
VHVQPLEGVVFGPVRPALGVLVAGVGLLLLLSCVNVASLLLARGVSRTREVAVRAALGADRRRIARQFAVESLLLTLAAAAGAVALAALALRGLGSLVPPELPRSADIGIDVRVVAISLGTALLMAAAFGLLPVWHSRRLDLSGALAAGGGRVAGGSHRARMVLVIAEVALAVALTTAAGLLVRSFWQLQHVDPGFSTAGVLKAQFQLPRARYPISTNAWPPEFSNVRRFNAALVERAAALPGVEAAALTAYHPLDHGYTTSFTIAGREQESRDFPEVPVRIVSSGYFRTLGIPVLRGELFRDAGDAPPTAVINDVMAERFFAGRDPIGHAIRLFGLEWRIVGVVGRERFRGLAAQPPIAVYISLGTVPALSGAEALVVRTRGDAASLAPDVRTVVRHLDPQLAVFGVEPLAATLDASLSRERFLMLLVGVFAAIALTLAAVGIHGLLAYTVAQRTREIGIRMALGASAPSVLRQVTGEGARIVGAGLVAGSVLALAFARMLSGLLFGVSPADPLTLAGMIALLAVVAALAIWSPARRAVTIDPIHALRVE